jgi:glutamate-1-semialdehyde aminotransferase
VSPHYLSRGKGCRVWDVDGNEYIDYIGALGPITLGYGFPAVDDAIRAQLESGALLSLPHPLEIEVAELLVKHVPCAEMVRYTKTGSEANSAAVRIARAYTGRDVIVQSGYHGWHDWYAITKDHRNRGIPAVLYDYIVSFPYNNISALERVLDEQRGRVAAITIEPSIVGPPASGFLEACRELAHAHGALLVFDEVVTGFRLALGGAQERFGVIPDLAVFGKAMANGMPLSAVMGRRDVMQSCDDIFYSSTFGGEMLSLAACKAVIETYVNEPVVQHLEAVGGALMKGSGALIEKRGLSDAIGLAGFDCRSMFLFKTGDGGTDLFLKSLFHQEVVKRGILCNGYHNMTYAHQPSDVERTCAVYDEVFALLSDAVNAGDVANRLEGPPMQDVFRPVQ